MEIIGHEKQRASFERLVKSENLGHAYLLSGPEGIGKFDIALSWTQKASELDNINHPDILVIQPESLNSKGMTKKKEIKIEAVRKIHSFLSLSPMEAKRRVVIINDAHRLTIQAQNALLKILEEPSSNALIFLTTYRPDKIIATVRSRVQNIRFGLISAEKIQKNMPQTKNGDEEWLLACGRPRWILEKNEDFEEAIKELGIISSDDLSQKMKLAETLAKDTPQALEKLKLYLVLLRTVSLKNNPDPIKIKRPAAFLFMLETRKTIKLLADTNVNTRLALENLFLKLTR